MSKLGFTSLKVILLGIGIFLTPHAKSSAEGMKSFAPIVEPLLPSVVNISTTTDTKSDRKRNEHGFPGGGTPLEEFLKHFMEEYQQQRPRKSSSLGSGFLISQKGSTVFVVTCYHVIADADEIKIILNDGKEYKAEIAGKNLRTDLAVLKFTTSEKLTTVKWGDSKKSRVGDWVIAIGNPFGLSSTVTTGIISSIARDIGARSRGLLSSIVEGFIQTDASINLGNSGGPMFNAQGEVIGINTAIYSPNGGSIGIGFAIPSSLAETVVKDLMTKGYAFSGWIGVMVQKVTKEMAESIGLSEARGALVGEVTPSGPAEKAKLMTGDVILKFNNILINDSSMLPSLVAKSAVNQNVPIVIYRDGKEITLHVVVGDFEKARKEGLISSEDDKLPKPMKMTKTFLGLGVQSITSTLKERFGLPESAKGVVIVSIDPDSEAAEKNLRVGDVIVAITVKGTKTTIDSPDKYESVITAAKKAGHGQILLLIMRAGMTQFVTLGLKEPEQEKDKEQVFEVPDALPIPLPGR